ncbi:butyrophilin subfamily 2 member A2-like isoform X2 [Hoplias malabaricus]
MGMYWTWLLVPLGLCSSESFSIVVPPVPVLGSLGGSIILPCSLSPVLNAKSYEVLWYRPQKIHTPLLTYINQAVQENLRNVRASLAGELEKGNASLRLENISLADEGIYICRVEKTDEWYDEANVTLQVKIQGSAPVLSVVDVGEGQLNVSCHSHGWSPEPSLIWRGRDGQSLKHLSKNKFIKGSGGLVNVSSWLLVSSSVSEWLSCSVGFADSDPGWKECRMLPHTCTDVWKGAFITTLSLLLLCIIAVGVYCVLHQKGLIGFKRKSPDYKYDKNESSSEVTQPLMQQNKPPAEDTPLQSVLTETESQISSPVGNSKLKEKTPHSVVPPPVTVLIDVVDHGSAAVDQQERSPQTVQQPQTPTEWDEMKKFKVKITIDPEETPQFFRVSHEGKGVNCPKPRENHEDEKLKIFCLCKETFSSGKHYWKVNVCRTPKEKLSWFVGVASAEAERLHRIPLTPQNGFWVLCYEKERGVYIRDSPIPSPLSDVSDKLTTVGVFLDCDQHTVSFYDVHKKSLIYTFTNVNLKTSLYPLISPGIRDNKRVHICVD